MGIQLAGLRDTVGSAIMRAFERFPQAQKREGFLRR